MAESLKMPGLKNIVSLMAFSKSFPLQLLINRIGLWSGKIELYRIWLE